MPLSGIVGSIIVDVERRGHFSQTLRREMRFCEKCLAKFTISSFTINGAGTELWVAWTTTDTSVSVRYIKPNGVVVGTFAKITLGGVFDIPADDPNGHQSGTWTVEVWPTSCGIAYGQSAQVVVP